MDNIVTVTAPVNIAVIKYWGKRDEELILPINDSVSCTLDMEYMCAKTTIMASPSFTENKFWLNNKEQDFTNKRLTNCLKEILQRANPANKALLQWKLHICSENNFPTAAGLASSAAGYACLVSSLAALYQVDGNISGIARLGSGSACRSVYGGFVQWNMGVKANGEDSTAVQIAPASHWPDLHLLILVVSDDRKKYSSTSGMKKSVETSELLKYRAEKIVPKRTSAIIEAIKGKNFEEFAKITMQDSNQFHAICLDTYPPCYYMNDVSRVIVEMVHAYNELSKSVKVAYTCDAGPNVCLYLLKDDVDNVATLINTIFPPTAENAEHYFKGIPTNIKNGEFVHDKLKLLYNAPGSLKYVIHTRLGDGPKMLSDPSQHLLTKDGLPKNL